MKKYKHIIFDLDMTLWDVKANQIEAHKQLYKDYEMFHHFSTYEDYFKAFKVINERKWLQYREGEIDKVELQDGRFKDLLTSIGIDNVDKAMALSSTYTEIIPTFNVMIPYAMDLMEYLHPKYDSKHLLTNGFKQVQRRKVENMGMSQFFLNIFTSEEAGVNKPYADIFHYALSKIGADVSECLMVGDDAVNDIEGASGVGMDTLFINIDKKECSVKPTYEVRSLKEIIGIL